MNLEVSLVVKSPSRTDFTCKLDLFEHCILDLQHKIQAGYAGNPPPDQQRLFFNGELLSGSRTLKDVLALERVCLIHTFLHI